MAHQSTTKVAASWLVHPATCAALATLLVNDHVLKEAWGNWLTGKLSDIAWLVVAPAVLGTAFAAVLMVVPRHDRSQPGSNELDASRVAAVSVVLTGAVFALVKTTATGAAMASAAMTVVAGPSTVLADPTDLLALPALGLAWAVSRSATGAVRAGPHDARRAGARAAQLRWAAVLPLAVLATSATSQTPPPSTMHVVVVDDVLMVGVSHGPSSPESATWFMSRDGDGWDALSGTDEDGAALIPLAVEATDSAAAFVCVPDDPDVCYRPGAGLRVERSADRGHGWSVDWAVPADVRERLEQRYEGEVPALATWSVAVLPTANGHRVYAANGGDGLATRHEDGTWERIGEPYRSSPPPVVPLPGSPTEHDFAVPWPAVLGVASAWLTAAAGTRRSPRPRSDTSPRGTGSTIVGVMAVGAAALVNASSGVIHGQPLSTGLGLGAVAVQVLTPLLVVVSAALLPVAVVRSRRQMPAAPTILAGLGVALITALVRPVPLAVLVALAATAGAAAIARTSSGDPGVEPRGTTP